MRTLELTDRLLQFNRAWKVDVVLEMDMLMQVLFEFPQAVIEGMKCRAGIRRSGEVRTQAANFSKHSSGSVVFRRHHCDWIRNRAEGAVRLGSSAGYGLLEASDVGNTTCTGY
jgi:hypothetical protein